jgi:hypothetical protein
MRHVQLSTKPDRLIWHWTTNGQYSSKSCYNALFEGALVALRNTAWIDDFLLPVGIIDMSVLHQF